jgi:hypothetical protein
MIRGNLRLIFSFLNSKEIEIIYHDFFELDFKSNFPQSEIIEILSNESDFLLEILNEKNILESGIFEVYGVYSHYLDKKYNYNYYNNDEYSFEWEFESINIKKYSDDETKDFIEQIYLAENPYFALDLLESLRLSKYLNKNRKLDCSIKNNSLFKE